MAIDVNADVYASKRMGIFFPAHNQTPLDGNLTGQCVTLGKWFLAEMCQVPEPFKARGHARSVGDTLVREGHAVEVSVSERKRGDLVVYVYGEYGHIGVLLSGGRLFQQNARVSGVASRVVDGETVYASTVVNVYPTLGGVAPRYYRVKTYVENLNGGAEMATTIPDADNYYWRYGQKLAMQLRGRALSRDEFRKYIVGQSDLRAVEILADDPEADNAQRWQDVGKVAVIDNWQGQINTLQTALGDRPTKQQLVDAKNALDQMNTQLADAKKVADQKVEENKKLVDQINGYAEKEAEDKQTADTWLRRLGQWLQKYLPNVNKEQ